MMVAMTLGGADVILTKFLPNVDIIPSTTIPFDVLGWFWVAISSIYCGGTALLNFFMSRNLHDIKGVEMSMGNLRRISRMNYFACFWFLAMKLVGADIPLEAIVSAAGACTILIVLGKKSAETAVHAFNDSDGNGVDDEIDALVQKIEARKKSGEFVDNRKTGRDDVVEELEELVEKRKKELKQATRSDIVKVDLNE
jgi:hypothetical protein